jgi:iron complex outermembrane recepter protein
MNGTLTKSVLLCSMALGSIGLLDTAAHADPQVAGKAEGNLAEIVVTAQKYEQRLQDVPLSISAVTADELAARNVRSLADMQFSVPGLSSFEYGPGVGYVQIRGVSTSIGNQTVGRYLDEMPINGDAQGSGIDVRLIDMQRVEVLRGPQGTLYGEGSMGGTIRYLTTSPDLNEFSGSVEAGGGQVTDGSDSVLATGVLNAPLSQGLAGLRMVAGYEKDGGWIDNTTTGQSDINGVVVKTGRATLKVTPSDRLSLSLLALHQDLDQDNQNFGTDGKTAATVDTHNRDRYTLVNGVLSYDFDAVTLLESAGYLDRTADIQYDLTPFYLPVLQYYFGVAPGAITQVSLPTVTDIKTYSNELRLSSRGNSRLHWTVGAYYRKFESDNSGTVGTAPGTLPVVILATAQDHVSKSWALFGEASYPLTENLSGTLGVRYYEDKVESTTKSTSFGFTTTDVGEETFTTFNPRVNLQYAFSRESMVYLGAAKGFRSGGFNLTSAGGGTVTIPPTYSPDKLWTYELGTKQQLLDRRLEFDWAVYWTDWTDVQSSFFVPGSAITVIQNGGKVSGWGTDVALTARPVDGLTLTATYGWNNLEYQNSTADKLEGDPVDNAIRDSYSASVDYRVPLAESVKGFVRVDYQHAGKAQITLRNFNNQIVYIDQRDLVNLRVGADWSRYEASIYADNVTNDRTPIIPGPFGVIVNNVEQRPRTVGIYLRARF